MHAAAMRARTAPYDWGRVRHLGAADSLTAGELQVIRAARRIGLGEMTRPEMRARHALLTRAIRTALDRKDPPTSGADLLAVRTQIPLIPQQAWDRVPGGSLAVVASVAGTNWDFRVAQKEPDGGISLRSVRTTSYGEKNRRVPFSVFVDRVATSIAEASQLAPGGVPVAGISLGFPHRNWVTSGGVEAELLTESGSLPKKWAITDWPSLSSSDKVFGRALKQSLERMEVNLRTVSIVNDTFAVALDSGAAQAARNEGLEVLPAGVVGGTGTNAAVDRNGLVNLELGHAAWPGSEISKRMAARSWTESSPELEHETGMYLIYRLAAGIELLGEHGLLPDGTTSAVSMLEHSQQDSAFISHLATGSIVAEPVFQLLARQVLCRAGQTYGIMLGAVGEVTGGERGPDSAPMALLAEGSVLLRGECVVATAQSTAARLGRPVVVRSAEGLKGVGALALAWSHLAAA